VFDMRVNFCVERAKNKRLASKCSKEYLCSKEYSCSKEPYNTVLSRRAPSIGVPVLYYRSCSGARSGAKGGKGNSGRNGGQVSVLSVSAIGHLGASGARSRGDHPEGVSWGYVRVARAGRRRKETRPRRAGGSPKVKERPGDGNMSVEDQGGAGLGSRVQECVATA
jgi:hypothetical protein